MEQDRIREQIKNEFPNVHAAILYGSTVSGYASSESDKDIIVILDRFPQLMKYIYKGEYSYLVVDKKAFEEDVSDRKYGEFVAARLTNPYIPILNEEYISFWEVEEKKKIIQYEIKKLVLKKGKVAGRAEIGILFFPFRRWEKIVRIYPPYRYSIENTLRIDLREKNLEMILPGYEKAIVELETLLEKIDKGKYRINEKHINKILAEKDHFELVRMYEKELKEGIERYKAHEHAGHVGRAAATYEVLHKIKRSIKHFMKNGFLRIIDNPYKYVRYT